MDEGGAKTWTLTGSLDNFRATREREFRVIGMKEGTRRMAEQVEPGDRIVFYVTGVQAFGGMPELVLEEDRFVPADGLAQELEHVRKWPLEHWHLAFQGQLHKISAVDAATVAGATGQR